MLIYIIPQLENQGKANEKPYKQQQNLIRWLDTKLMCKNQLPSSFCLNAENQKECHSHPYSNNNKICKKNFLEPIKDLRSQGDHPNSTTKTEKHDNMPS